MIDVRNSRDPKITKEQEYMTSKQEEQSALLEYVAVMTDVELPTEDNGVDENE